MSDVELEAKVDPKILDSDAGVFFSGEVDQTIEEYSFPREIREQFSERERAFTLTTFKFNTWNPDSLHWEAPSSMTFETDGRIYLFVDRIANHRRHGPFKIGKTYTWRVDYTFKDANKVPMQSDTLKLRTLKHNQTKNNADAEKIDEFLRANWREIEWFSVTRRIHR